MPTGTRNYIDAPKPRYGLCPSCKSRKLAHPNASYHCMSCDFYFPVPLQLAALKRKESNSGQIAPLSYRAQLARDILQANAEAAARVNSKKTAQFFGRPVRTA